MSAVKLVFEFDNLEAAQIFLSNHLGFAASVPAHPVAALPAAIAQASPAALAKPVKEAKAPKPAAAPAPVKQPNGPVAAAVTYDAVKAACMKLANKKGREALVKVLASLNLTNAQDAKPEQYARVIENCEIAFLAEDALA